MKKISIILISILFITSCNNKIQNDKGANEILNNALLAKKVTISHLVKLDNEYNTDTTSGFNRLKFFNDIFKDIYSGKFKDCYTNNADTNKYTIDGIIKRMTTGYKYNPETKEKTVIINNDKPDLSQIEQMFFKESWNFDKEKIKFTKKISYWYPVRIYYRPEDISKKDLRRRLV